MMKAILFLASMLLPGGAVAADWVEINETPNKIVLLDAESIDYSNADRTQRQAWVKFVMLDDSEHQKGDYALGFSDFDCSSGAVKFNEVLLFSSNGTLKTNTNLRSQGWHNVPSESLYGYVNETVCSYPMPQIVHSPATEGLDFRKEVHDALQKNLSIGGAKITSLQKIAQDAPGEFSVDFEWSINGESFSCSGSIETNANNQVIQASVPYVCYRPFIDK